MIRLYTQHLFLFYFETLCVVCSLDLGEVRIYFKFFGCRLPLMIFVVSKILKSSLIIFKLI